MSSIKYIFASVFAIVLHSCVNKSGNLPQTNSGNYLDSNQSNQKIIEGLDFLTSIEKDSLSELSNTFPNSFNISSYVRLNEDRKFEILRLKAGMQDSFSGKAEGQIPLIFKRFITNEEFQRFNSDSIMDLIRLNEMMKNRRQTIENIIHYRMVNFLSNKEVLDLIEHSYKDSSYYQTLAINRYKKDSTDAAVRFNKRIDSLQLIIHPVDSILPFGAKQLGEMLDVDKKYLGFSFPQGDTLSDLKDIKSRKDIYDIWMYFLKFHSNAELDWRDNYDEKLLPPIKTYDHIQLGIETINNDQKIDPRNPGFPTRISDINGYEVYYSTTGMDYPVECSTDFKEIDDCCFAHQGYDCSTAGYITLYNRERQHATIIPTYILQYSQSFDLQIQFFYIKNNVIHIFDGRAGTRFGYDKSGTHRKMNYVEISNEYGIEIFKNGNITSTQNCILKSDTASENNGEKDINAQEAISNNHILFSKKRNEILRKIQPVFSQYPYGPTLIKEQIDNGADSLTLSKAMMDSLLGFYVYQNNENSYYTIPVAQSINTLAIGPVEFWDMYFLQNLKKSASCINLNITASDVTDYKLPSINNLEVYLSRYPNNGVLTFYDPESQIANVVHVLDARNDSFLRFFYINPKGQIEIYQGSKKTEAIRSADSQFIFAKTHIVEVMPNREVKVIKQDQN